VELKEALEWVFDILDIMEIQLGPYRAIFNEPNQSHIWHCWGCEAEMVESWGDRLGPEDFKHDENCKYVEAVRTIRVSQLTPEKLSPDR